MKRNLCRSQGVQRRATKHMLGNNLDYQGWLKDLSILPLSYRRVVQYLTFFLNCLPGKFAVPIDTHTLSSIHGGVMTFLSKISDAILSNFTRHILIKSQNFESHWQWP